MKVGKRVWPMCLVLLAVICVPLLVWVTLIAAFRQIFAEWRGIRGWLVSTNLTCSIDVDCPPGYQCIGDTCVPIQVR